MQRCSVCDVWRPKMGYGHSLDLRRRSASSAVNLVQRWRETGSFAPGQIGGHRQTWLNPERSVFIDETGAKTTMAWLRGRALCHHGQSPQTQGRGRA